MKHGSRSTFVNHGCRCLPCRSANARYDSARTAKIRNGEWEYPRSSKKAKGIVRRLMREGFTKDEIARRLGIKQLVIKKTIRPTTEARLQKLYDTIMVI